MYLRAFLTQHEDLWKSTFNHFTKTFLHQKHITSPVVQSLGTVAKVACQFTHCVQFPYRSVSKLQ